MYCSLPEEFDLRSLNESDADFIYQKWPNKFLNLEEFKTCIKYNPTTALYRKADDFLIAWTILCENGMSGNLFVHEDFRQLKLGKYVTIAQGLKLQKDRRISYGVVAKNNEVALNFFKSFLSTVVGSIITIKMRRKPQGEDLLGKL